MKINNLFLFVFSYQYEYLLQKIIEHNLKVSYNYQVCNFKRTKIINISLFLHASLTQVTKLNSVLCYFTSSKILNRSCRIFFKETSSHKKKSRSYVKWCQCHFRLRTSMAVVLVVLAVWKCEVSLWLFTNEVSNFFPTF